MDPKNPLYDSLTKKFSCLINAYRLESYEDRDLTSCNNESDLYFNTDKGKEQMKFVLDIAIACKDLYNLPPTIKLMNLNELTAILNKPYRDLADALGLAHHNNKNQLMVLNYLENIDPIIKAKYLIDQNENVQAKSILSKLPQICLKESEFVSREFTVTIISAYHDLLTNHINDGNLLNLNNYKKNVYEETAKNIKRPNESLYFATNKGKEHIKAVLDMANLCKDLYEHPPLLEADNLIKLANSKETIYGRLTDHDHSYVPIDNVNITGDSQH